MERKLKSSVIHFSVWMHTMLRQTTRTKLRIFSYQALGGNKANCPDKNRREKEYDLGKRNFKGHKNEFWLSVY